MIMMEADEGLDNMLKGMVGDEAIEHLPIQCYGRTWYTSSSQLLSYTSWKAMLYNAGELRLTYLYEKEVGNWERVTALMTLLMITFHELIVERVNYSLKKYLLLFII